MDKQITPTQFRTKNILYIISVTALLLLIPLIAMQFSREVNWTGLDFAIMGTLIFTSGMAYDFLSQKFPGKKLVISFIVLGLFLYIWAELAVGVFTNLGN